MLSRTLNGTNCCCVENKLSCVHGSLNMTDSREAGLGFDSQKSSFTAVTAEWRTAVGQLPRRRRTYFFRCVVSRGERTCVCTRQEQCPRKHWLFRETSSGRPIGHRWRGRLRVFENLRQAVFESPSTTSISHPSSRPGLAAHQAEHIYLPQTPTRLLSLYLYPGVTAAAAQLSISAFNVVSAASSLVRPLLSNLWAQGSSLPRHDGNRHTPSAAARCNHLLGFGKGLEENWSRQQTPAFYIAAANSN